MWSQINHISLRESFLPLHVGTWNCQIINFFLEMEEICKFTADPLGKINGSLNKSGIANGNNGLTTKSFMPTQSSVFRNC